jgi:hypothetical protein
MVFVLHDIEGYSHEEIATITGLAPGTARAALACVKRGDLTVGSGLYLIHFSATA